MRKTFRQISRQAKTKALPAQGKSYSSLLKKAHTNPDFIILRSTDKSPSPSLAGQTVIANQAVLLAPVHRLPAPSQVSPVTYLYRLARCYSGGTAPAYTGFPIKSCDTCSSVCDFAGPLNESVFLEKCPIDSCYYTMPKSNYQAQQTKKGCRL